MILEEIEISLTQDLTPPIKPSVYPVIKSFALVVVDLLLSMILLALLPTPSVGLLGPDDPPTGLLGLSPLEADKKAERAGLCGRLGGRLAGQNPFSSLLSSWPVVVQLLRMLSRRSWT